MHLERNLETLEAYGLKFHDLGDIGLLFELFGQGFFDSHHVPVDVHAIKWKFVFESRVSVHSFDLFNRLLLYIVSFFVEVLNPRIQSHGLKIIQTRSTRLSSVIYFFIVGHLLLLMCAYAHLSLEFFPHLSFIFIIFLKLFINQI